MEEGLKIKLFCDHIVGCIMISTPPSSNTLVLILHVDIAFTIKLNILKGDTLKNALPGADLWEGLGNHSPPFLFLNRLIVYQMVF